MKRPARKLSTTLILLTTLASTDALGKCNQGGTCIIDTDGNRGDRPGQIYTVTYDNKSWEFNAYQKWSNRADVLQNRSSTMNNCLYDLNYDRRSTIPRSADWVLLRRGMTLDTRRSISFVAYETGRLDAYWRNRVSSNIWTRAYSCLNP